MVSVTLGVVLGDFPNCGTSVVFSSSFRDEHKKAGGQLISVTGRNPVEAAEQETQRGEEDRGVGPTTDRWIQCISYKMAYCAIH